MADVREDVPKEMMPLLSLGGWTGVSLVRGGEGQCTCSEQWP